MRERFESKVNKTGSCWLWTGSYTGNGYGSFPMNGKSNRAHRISWEIYKGPIPDGLWVLHKCDVRLCVNPQHLFLGTRRENIDDMLRKGRAQFGAKNHNAKLTAEDVREIIRLHKSGVGLAQIAAQFNIHRNYPRQILCGLRWKHITSPQSPMHH